MVRRSLRRALCFRFDVDTRACIDRGVPNLAVLAKETGTAFTFFVTMGRAVLRSRQLVSLLSMVAAPAGPRRSVKLSALRKLGPAEFARMGAFNPSIGASRVPILRVLYCAGHELALHGGRNHEAWQRFAHTWSERRIRTEIQYGLTRLRTITTQPPAGFASPGWNGSVVVNRVLEQLGFQYVADSVGREGGKRPPSGPAHVGPNEHCG